LYPPLLFSSQSGENPRDHIIPLRVARGQGSEGRWTFSV
jgi:hypothetical protein